MDLVSKGVVKVELPGEGKGDGEEPGKVAQDQGAPPTSSTRTRATADSAEAGIPRPSVVPATPPRPWPSSFWPPWAIKMRPTTNRRTGESSIPNLPVGCSR